jgi:hypothetical protein
MTTINNAVLTASIPNNTPANNCNFRMMRLNMLSFHICSMNMLVNGRFDAMMRYTTGKSPLQSDAASSGAS